MSSFGPLLQGSFYFLRHGETADNARGIVMGRRDVPLSERGRAQAVNSARLLTGRPISCVYASPLVRAFETASIVNKTLALELAPDPGLMERCWGEWEGRPRSERPTTLDVETAEPFADFSARVLAALAPANQPGELRPLFVAHNGVWRVLIITLKLEFGDEPVGNAQPFFVEPVDGAYRFHRLDS